MNKKNMNIDIPRQYVKVKTLAWLKQPQKEKLLLLIWDSKNSALSILRGILQTNKDTLQYLEEQEWLASEQEIPASIFIQDNEITDETKNIIKKLFGEIVLAKRIRFLPYEQANKIVRNIYWKNELPKNIKKALNAIKYNPKTLYIQQN